MNLKKFDIFYIIGLVATTLFMILELIFKFVPLDFTFLIFFWTMNLLSGFGLILTVANGILWILNRFTEKFDKKHVQALVIIQIIVPAILTVYAIYNIVSNLPPATPLTGVRYWFNLILFLYGIISLMASLYIIPLIREEFQDAVEKGLIKQVKIGAKKVGRGIKKKYFTWRGKYAKVQIQDQMTLGEVLGIWKSRFAVYLLIPLAIGSLIFTPVTFVCIIYWLKIFILDKGEPEFYERIALIISMIFIAIIAIVSYTFNLIFYASIQPLFWTTQIFYLAGILISSGIFIYRFAKLRGITIKKIKEQIKEIKSKITKEKETEETEKSE